VARRATPTAPAPANLSASQIKEAIPLLQRRIGELRALDVDALNEESGDDVLKALVHKIDDSLVRIFGPGTIEYNRYSVHSLSGRIHMSVMERADNSIARRRDEIREEVRSAISRLTTLVETLIERLEDSGETPSGRALRAYEGLDLHPEITRAASKLYRDGHYANAVEAAVKALNALVRLRSGLEVDGSTLMERAFSPKAPVLAFNSLASPSDQDEQRGFMMLFSGAVAGLRNPRAHGFIKDDPERALEFIAFVRLLAKLLDGASMP
jgi:uncharacterized protein (TIGR02391 family)